MWELHFFIANNVDLANHEGREFSNSRSLKPKNLVLVYTVTPISLSLQIVLPSKNNSTILQRSSMYGVSYEKMWIESGDLPASTFRWGEGEEREVFLEDPPTLRDPCINMQKQTWGKKQLFNSNVTQHPYVYSLCVCAYYTHTKKNIDIRIKTQDTILKSTNLYIMQA